MKPDSAKDIVEHARDQARAANCGQLPDALDGLPADAFPGFHVVRRIKRGGQGVVYAGIEQTTGKRVAIKVLRWGPFRGRAEQLRFDREIQILARLEHPHIVTIHSSGLATGHPYYVMDYVAGRTLEEYLDEENKSIDALLALFLKICDAVHAAHVQGIVHRDLKPGNIRIDEHGEPRVLDFGLAKPLTDDVVRDPEATETGQFVGSLPWAAPEQLAVEKGPADLRTDVYGLGLILYTMLTNTLPFEPASNLRDVMDDILQRDPAPLRALNPRVDAELATIVSTCLHKEPSRRYQIAGELARDIERYRAGLPIAAKRDSTGYLLAKTIRRHRAVAGLLALLVLLSTGYGLTISLLYHSAQAAEKLASQRAADAREKYMLARGALEFVVNQVSQNLVGGPKSHAVRRAILESALPKLATLAEQHGDDPLLRSDLMRTHYLLGSIALDLGRSDLALPHLQAALDLRQTLQTEQPPTPDERADLSINHVLVGDALHQSGDKVNYVNRYREALVIDEQLAADYPDNAHYLDNLAWSYDRLGAYESRAGNWDEAERLHRLQLDLMERATSLEPENWTRLHGLAQACFRVGLCVSRRYEWATVVELSERAVAAGRRGLALNSDVTQNICQHVRQLCWRGGLLGNSAPRVDRENLYFEAEKWSGLLVELEPDVPRHRILRATVLTWLTSSPAVADDPWQIERLLLEALEAVDAALAQTKPTIEVCWKQADIYQKLSVALENQHRADEAAECRQQALAMAEEAHVLGGERRLRCLCRARVYASDPGADPSEVQYVLDTAKLALLGSDHNVINDYLELGLAYRKIGALGSALEMLDKAEELASEQNRPLSGSVIQELR
jgi:serine/threonine protein kinase